MRQMTVPDLRRKYADVFGETTRSRHKEFLIKRIAWRIQANIEGGLSARALCRAEELANDADLRIRRPPAKPEPSPATTTMPVKVDFGDRPGLPMPGTILTRPYRGRTIRVTVLDNGFEYEGEVYRSLSAVAKAVTGSHWSGNYFFGLKGRSKA